MSSSGNEKINNFIQERQLKANSYNNVVFEWIPYNQFNEIKETGKNGSMTVYSAIWKNGPLYYSWYAIRDSNKEVALKCLHDLQNPVDYLINEVKKYSIKNNEFLVLYGISQNPDTSDYILVQNYLILSGNENIDDFVQKRQLKINSNDDVKFEWIPYNQFNEIKETGRSGAITVYSAIWNNGPLHKEDRGSNNYTRDSNKEVALKYLHNLQNPVDSLINEVKKYSTKNNDFLVLYGISQNPVTSDYILVQNYLILSGNENIDDFIQERQLNIYYYYSNCVVFEWIPYNQFNEIKETGKNGSITVYSAIWKNGPLHKENRRSNYYTRDSNKEVALKYLHNLQNPVDSLINEVKKYSIKNNEFLVLYGISQNPVTSDYILVQNYLILSGNEKIDDFIQERQLKINDYDDDDINNIVFEWIPYNQFNEIKETDKNGSITVYSAIWKNGPLQYNENEYIRVSNKEVALKCLHNLQYPVDSLINEVKKYSTKNNDFLVLYGISQNPVTSDYILVVTWTSGNEKIDDFIQEKQLEVKYSFDVVFEWIPYNQFNEIEETGKNGSITVYSAIWKNGPLHKKHWKDENYTRDSNKEVALKCLHNLQNPIDSLINEVKKYSTKNNDFLVLYGISQNPVTSDYILVQNYLILSGNENIDDFIQERQLNIYYYYSNCVVFEWIPYNQFNEIKETGKNGSITVYSAIWKNGPLHKKHWKDKNYTRDSNKEVALKYLHNLQNPVDSLINEVKKYSTKNNEFLVLYGISQNPVTSDYILVQNYLILSGNEKIDDFIQERQLKINDYDDDDINNIVFEWIPYNQFNEIKETDKNGSITVYSAIWKNGPLQYNENEYIRVSNKEVALKCLHNLQYPVDSLINEVKKYSTKNNDFLVLYGISQNPVTSDYILVQNYLILSGNEKIDDFIQERQLKINDYDDDDINNIVFEWIPYNQFNEIKETDKNGSITVYSAIWKNGPLQYNENEYIRVSNKEVALKCLHNLQYPVDSLINEAKKYSTKFDMFLVLYGISQNPVTSDYILVQNYLILSGNEKIDDFIQERQLNINSYNNVVFEWIPYNQFNEIKETGKNNSITVYSAIWKNGPLHYNYHNKYYTRDSNKEVALKFLHNSQNSIESVINKAKKYDEFLILYGISQNPNTNDYILALFSEEYCVICDEICTDIQYKWCKPCKFMGWKSGNDKIDNLLIQLKINEPSDLRFEWIPYNQFNKIRNTGKGHFVTVCSAIWEYEVTLLCYNDSQKLLVKVKEFDSSFKIYGLSQNSDKKDYILVLQKEYCLEYGKGGFAVVYSAIWKDGPLKYDIDKKTYTRVSNKKIALKCLNNSSNLIDKFLNEVKEYSINKKSDILNVYGISQNPDTNNFIIVLEYAEGGSFNNWINNNYKYFDWKNKIQTLLYIIEGLNGIHQNKKVHHDLHPGNILFLTKSLNTFNRKSLFISDMGLCEDVNNTSEVQSYGVISYMAPEVLRNEAYTQAADVYSFGDSNAIEIRKQFIEAEIYRKSHLSDSFKKIKHPQAIYTSQLVPNFFTEDFLKSEYLSCAILDK
ncbi:uncharacterized protein OCT59_008475 [Rhizophagus irregularis]|uniref:uncharacterized protein n=1 Tax=Rhizophagus irregularis TaxID=588596 RepID=UPI00332B203F|nr:hypothetical protein OCT59_008475 [Rhizophagus irregularis]